VANSDGGGDKINLKLPGMQLELLKAIRNTGKPVVLVLLNGSPVELNWADENIDAILEAWYPGEEGGNAVADIIFGDYNPAGRLPITFVKSMDQLPPFRDYNMKNRTYRYMEEDPLYPFGYGLSFTKFEYSNLVLNTDEISTDSDKQIEVTVNVKNIGEMTGDEVVQLYISDLEASVFVPKWDLRGFKRINLKPGEEKEIKFTIEKRQFALIDDKGKCKLEPGKFRIYIGGQQPDSRSKNLTGRENLAVELNFTGDVLDMEY
ncbi:MAG: glycoside hydrolase family 3 C-terminal domain-containing protein, partial [Bacillota bacterium]